MVQATSNAEGLQAASRARAAASQNLLEMGNTITRMQTLLKEMRASTNRAKDPVAQANLEMWTLMLDQLDQQYEQLRIAARQREDLEARRAALYQQAGEKAAETAKRAREAANAAAAAANRSSQTPANPSATPTTATPPSSSASAN